MLTLCRLKNLYVYFWRWATLKVFGSGWHDTNGSSQIRIDMASSALLRSAELLDGPGYQKFTRRLAAMPAKFRSIDFWPGGHKSTGCSDPCFSGGSNNRCASSLLRACSEQEASDAPARLRYASLPNGKREAKFDAFGSSFYHGLRVWEDGAVGWRARASAKTRAPGEASRSYAELFEWSGPGVKPAHRTWPIAPDVSTLEARWERPSKGKRSNQEGATVPSGR